MTPAELREQIEDDLTWRIDEIRFLRNIGSGIADESDASKFRRALVLMLYANFEGFCKFALTTYVSAINQEGVECRVVSPAIAAASLHDVLATFRYANRKSPVFRNDAPNDAELHAFARDVEFIQRAEEIMRQVVYIPDTAVNTESNLAPVVLRKNLYRLGLPFDALSQHDGILNKLLAFRNGIAHGADRNGIDSDAYEALQTAAFKVMGAINLAVFDAFERKLFLRAA